MAVRLIVIGWCFQGRPGGRTQVVGSSTGAGGSQGSPKGGPTQQEAIAAARVLLRYLAHSDGVVGAGEEVHQFLRDFTSRP